MAEDRLDSIVVHVLEGVDRDTTVGQVWSISLRADAERSLCMSVLRLARQ